MNRLVQDVMRRKSSEIEVIEPDETIDVAVEWMTSRHVGSLLVVSEGRLVGILTERDLLVRVLAARCDPMTTEVQEVMTRQPLVVIGPQATVAEALAIVTRTRCRHLPVVDGDRILGLVSAGDLTASLVQEQQTTIDDLYVYITR
jgi:CBS domain-containing protein